MKKIKNGSLIKVLVESCFNKNGAFDKENAYKALAFIKQMANLNQKSSLLQEFKKGIERKKKMHLLEIETPVDIDDAQVKNVVSLLSSNHTIAEVEKKVNPGLIGGVRIKIGDLVFDGSILNTIEGVNKKAYA